ncbi:crustin 2 [Penaeus vannamei]|uniref:Crustin 2 n=1 Tax=Penaeus vannamei TaxID=6689 RepID=A0A3R7PBG0_PENVA|nr:crustin 2 [Penaeus vannamei]
MCRVYRRLQDELLMRAGNGLFIGLQSACSCQHSQWQQHEERLSCKNYCPGPYGDQYACCDPKPGTCPSPPRCTDIFDGNVPFCYVDSDCPRDEKCCEDACNPGKICISLHGLEH